MLGAGVIGALAPPADARAGAPPLRFGITPLAQAGQIGDRPAPAVGERLERTFAALDRLRPPRAPFVVRLNRFFWSDGERAFTRYLALARRFAGRGYLVELQVRYRPPVGHEGDIAAWARHVREVVRRFGRIRNVVALQIANEVNFDFSRDSSDGAFRGARRALVAGVIAAQNEKQRLRLRRLEVGFNWAYRRDEAYERDFWRDLRRLGGRRFLRAVDWVGIDAYPGTVLPRPSPGLDEGLALVTAVRELRGYMQLAGLPRSTPVRIEECGWPTFPGRSERYQATALERMVRAAWRARRELGITDLRWFNLRDGDSSSPLPFQHFGLLRSDYSAKPAFAVFRQLLRTLLAAGR
ncbi:hypothetical protein SAMN02745716_1494 [Thermoleophilum album]|uniref:Glycoside hydrolase family 5 domain-containing protein n=1 Tax=Thermoleophilum album TaxID=29539 RepID=A0A1H6FTD0_THEAL|nr:hypothetical protein SAMN02745716_1494 [Thermoleophilum album]